VLVLGGGWAAAAFLRGIDTERYDVCVASPRNYFAFTPLLPSCTVGTTEPRSVVTPLREVAPHHSHGVWRRLMYAIGVQKPREPACVEAECVAVDVERKVATFVDTSNVTAAEGRECETGAEGSNEDGTSSMASKTPKEHRFDLAYDRLVVSVGAQCNTFGTPGVVEHAHFLKEVADARRLRDRIVDSFESAASTASEATKRRLLRTVVVGGGPTGVEFAAELEDYLHHDLARTYSDAKYASVVLVQSADHLLNTYDKAISEFTEANLASMDVEVVKRSRVLEVGPRSVVVRDKRSGAKRTIECGTTVWSTGIAARPLTRAVMAQATGDAQRGAKALRVDPTLRAHGLESVWALGDCSSVANPRLMDELAMLFREADADGSGALSRAEFRALLAKAAERVPSASMHLQRMSSSFDALDADKDGTLSLEELNTLATKVDKQNRAYPATAQVAEQQGEYLATQFNHQTNANADTDADPGFIYRHKGELCYVGGDKAVAGVGGAVLTGSAAGALWHGAYLSMMHSRRMQACVALDWAKVKVFGRDTSRC
jgi:NADH dehydrogenase FAD-containing subunit